MHEARLQGFYNCDRPSLSLRTAAQLRRARMPLEKFGFTRYQAPIIPEPKVMP